jgi:integrase
MDEPNFPQRVAAVNETNGVSVTRDSSARKLSVMPKAKPGHKKRDRVRGTGHLFQRGPMYWFELHYGGERFRESLKTTDREQALEKMALRIAEIRSGEATKKFEPISVQALYDIWIAEIERTCKPRTLEDYKSRWTAHLEPVFGHLFATQVTKDVVSKYLTARKRAGAGNITQNRENRVLQMIFNYNKKKISANAYPEFPEMHSEKNHVRQGRLSKADFQTLLTRLEDPKNFWLQVLVTLTFKFGFRKSELLNATVSYFDAKAATFTLPGFTTKNKQPRRVPIARDGAIYKMLTELTKGRPPDASVFTRNGKAVRDYRGAWAVLTEGIQGGSGLGGRVTIHDLRRSAISEARNKGLGAKDMGTHMTLDVYSRYEVRNEAEEQATAAKIEGD